VAERRSPLLPRLPSITLEAQADCSPTVTSRPGAPGPFLSIARTELVARYPDGTASEPFVYDMIQRRAYDAVVIVAHYVTAGARRVFLRSCLRPPVALRPLPPAHDGAVWELPAGLIEPGESPTDAAVRELDEELGFSMQAQAFKPLGPLSLPASGLIGEHHYFMHVEVDPTARHTPLEDGSALERHASIIELPLADALEHCRAGSLPDAKTELGLRRLAELA
jgi:ADP-ribose pyrophosphatase